VSSPSVAWTESRRLFMYHEMLAVLPRASTAVSETRDSRLIGVPKRGCSGFNTRGVSEFDPVASTNGSGLGLTSPISRHCW